MMANSEAAWVEIYGRLATLRDDRLAPTNTLKPLDKAKANVFNFVGSKTGLQLPKT